MHQIYSCSDENLEVFTTVISSKSCSPARRKAKGTQRILAKSVVAVSEYRPPRMDELLPRQCDLIQVLYRQDEVRNFGCLQKSQQRFFSGKCAAKHMGSSEQESSKSYANHSDGKFSFPASPVTHIKTKQAVVTASATDDSAFAEDYRRHSKKSTDYDLALTPGAEASLPLTGSNLCRTPGILRKMWMKHKKKPEYLGATNSAFEAD
ncbi:PREDICTED: uncharacterized protein C8orf46 homolog isoform X1 [Gavialis gangeticus]|uniref:uncharacterized protein C8orf46 homolog isoform X1 n=1 Tax=Gavialis gangeticus TaxID=94835 RepID=UPI00092E649C|nr:PREDICTED: uncharacterized protein C8orf46 homolog isoform X1 [Gavialis gangeticus]